MKVVFASRSIFPFHGYGGMEMYAYYLGKYLAENGLDVELITTTPSNKNVDYMGKLKYTFLPFVMNNKYTNPINYQRFVKNCAKYLSNTDFDIFHSYGITAYHYLKSMDRNPVIVQPFGSEEFEHISKENVIRRFYLDYFIRSPKVSCVRHADSIASEGELQTQEIIDLFKVQKKRIFYLPDGVSLKEVNKYTENVEITKEDLNIQDADLVLINVNRLEPNKGVPNLINALKLLNEVIDVKLILVGKGSEETKINNQIKSLNLGEDVIHFKDISSKKMFQLYTLADISVTPTLYEGLPLVILEAMATGKPIVASNVSEVPQAVKDGENGFLVPPADPEAIASAVLRIYDKNLIVTMGNASKKIIKKYDWCRIAKMAISEYERLIGE